MYIEKTPYDDEVGGLRKETRIRVTMCSKFIILYAQSKEGGLVLCALENLGPISSKRNIPKIKRNCSDIR